MTPEERFRLQQMVNNDRTRYPTENLPKPLPMPNYHPWEFRKNYPPSHGGEAVPTPMVDTNQTLRKVPPLTPRMRQPVPKGWETWERKGWDRPDWDGTPYEGNPWELDISKRGLFGATDDQGRRTHEGLISGVKNIAGGVGDYFAKLFNDPNRMRLLRMSAELMNPASQYEQTKQGLDVYNPWGAFSKALDAGQQWNVNQQSIPMRYSVDAFGRVIDKRTGDFKGGTSGSGSGGMMVNLTTAERWLLTKMREKNPSITPFQIKYGQVQIPAELIKEYRQMNQMKLFPEITYKTKYTEHRAKSDSDLIDAIAINADNAYSANQELASQLSILDNPDMVDLFHPMADWDQFGREVATYLGFDFTDKMTSYQIFAKSSMEQLLKQLMQQKGPQTEGDAERAMKTLPKMTNTPLANKYILQMKKAINDRAIEKDKFKEEYLRTHDDLPKGLARAWYNSAPSKLSIFQRMHRSDPNLFSSLRRAGVISKETYEDIKYGGVE